MGTIIAGGCSFTFGHELSDDVKGQRVFHDSINPGIGSITNFLF